MTTPTLISVDIETNGPIPGRYSMFDIGAVVIEPALNWTFRGKLCPLYPHRDYEALKVTLPEGRTLDDYVLEIEDYPDARETMMSFRDWIGSVAGDRRPIFVSDCAFDHMFVYWYFHHFFGDCPFGHSSLNLGSLAKGLDRSLFSRKHKQYRQTPHDHNPLNDARGNAEAFLRLAAEFDLKGSPNR